MRFYQMDVFAEAPYAGNPLAVLPDAGELSAEQMQKIAREMNLSETSFVTGLDRGGYDVRIFTPQEELPFAGHPTIGTAWLLRRLQRIEGGSMIQRSAAGPTSLTFREERWWFERTGTTEPDLGGTKPASIAQTAAALGLDVGWIGFEARELGRSGRLMPAFADAGLYQYMVPVKDLDALRRCSPRPDLLRAVGGMGAYCFTAERAGYLRSRGFWPGAGVAEDPATGSACAALGSYLTERIGDVDVTVTQGVEIGRRSVMHLHARGDRIAIGGDCVLVLEGELESLP